MPDHDSNAIPHQLDGVLAGQDAADEPGEPGESGEPSGLYTAKRSSAIDSALTLAASQPNSPLSSPSAEKEQAVSPLDQAGAQLEGPGASEARRPPLLRGSTLISPAPTSPSSSPSSSLANASNFAAWSQVAAAFLLNAIAWGTPSMFGVYQLYYTQTLGLPTGTVSWVGSLQTFLTYLFSTASGQLADAGHAIPTALVGTLLVVGGGVWTSFSEHSLSQLFLAQAVCTGIGLGLLSAPALPSISAYFAPDTPRSDTRALALALSTIGSSVGGAVLPAVVQYLLPAAGFAWAVRCAALVALVGCVTATLLIRPVSVWKASPADEPEKSALHAQPVDLPTDHLDRQASPPLSSAPPSTSSRSWASYLDQVVDMDALHEVPFVLFLISSFFMYWGLYFGFNYMNVYAEKVIGLSSSSSTLLLIISTAMGIPTRINSGFVAGYYLGSLDCLIIMSFIMAVTIFCWLAVGTSTVGMYVFVICFGLANGGTQGVWLGSISELMLPATNHVTPDNSADNSADDAAAAPVAAPAASRIGARFGMACTVSAFATLAGPPTAAAIIGAAGNGYAASDYHGAIAWSASVSMVGVVATVMARIYAVGWDPRAGAKNVAKLRAKKTDPASSSA